MGLDFTNFRRKCFLFKQEVGLNFAIFVENASFSNKKWASISLSFVEITDPLEGRRAVSVGRVGGLLFRTHSQQRARASRGQLPNFFKF